jgi:hypothetical protein
MKVQLGLAKGEVCWVFQNVVRRFGRVFSWASQSFANELCRDSLKV